VRILDFTWAAAGPYATYLLAQLGAEVVKVEHTSRPDSARRGFQSPPADRMVDGPWPYGSADSSPNFNDLGANKRSIILDLSNPDASELVHRLLPVCDMVTSNFRPGVMDKLGLGAAKLLDEHPHLIVAEVSASGSSGPERNRPGYANVFAAAGGPSAQTGFPDGPPTEGGNNVDFRCGSAVAYSLLGALCDVIRRGDLADRYDTAARRKSAEAHLDAAITAWTIQRDPFEATEVLQQRGVRAMPCQSNWTWPTVTTSRRGRCSARCGTR
jgi:crotonobetainyl-CoA:carnitine CoA-transferase CaiB-like acyl-CoA transferase